MWFALQAAEHRRVVVVTKASPQESNSAYAQGGIAAVWLHDDHHDNHVKDTLVAGAGLCRRDAVEVTVGEGPARVRELIELGARFTLRDAESGEYDLHREGGHSHRRILHADDFTGAELVRCLYTACAENENIRFLDHHVAIDVITKGWLARQRNDIPPEPEEDEVIGAYVLDQRTGQVHTFSSPVVVIASGGAGKVYTFTTNPDVATGDGVAMAYRAGARIANMEFVQFHPTCLYHPKENSFLISEALRGEGGHLILPDGTRFMLQHDPRAELAPRDIVARAIDDELKRRGLECVYLDMRHLPADELQRKFPNIWSRLAKLGLIMSEHPIPVVPAAHYFCGGVQTDLMGESSIRNLFVVGEAACTGLHGANRLASNSLLEAMVFAERAAEQVQERECVSVAGELPVWEVGQAQEPDELVVIEQVWAEIRRFMWNYVGIVRTHRRLKRARRRIQLVQEEIDSYYWDFRITTDLIELRNLATVAELVVRSALKRRESRGLHYTLDFPESDDRFIQDTVLQRRMG
ncbi:MAG: L-aspartate oxidase [Kiritimatiellia bacterium]|jgi:L-aspartate oxidase